LTCRLVTSSQRNFKLPGPSMYIKTDLSKKNHLWASWPYGLCQLSVADSINVQGFLKLCQWWKYNRMMDNINFTSLLGISTLLIGISTLVTLLLKKPKWVCTQAIHQEKKTTRFLSYVAKHGFPITTGINSDLHSKMPHEQVNLFYKGKTRSSLPDPYLQVPMEEIIKINFFEVMQEYFQWETFFTFQS
jgi:hypothetical protein